MEQHEDSHKAALAVCAETCCFGFPCAEPLPSDLLRNLRKGGVCNVQVEQHEDSHKAAMAVCVEAYRAWLSTEARTDDITVIVIEFQLSRGLTCAHTPCIFASLHVHCGAAHTADTTAIATDFQLTPWPHVLGNVTSF